MITLKKYAYFRNNNFFGRREIYKIIPRNSKLEWDRLIMDNHISILTEYKTGINEYSFMGAELTELDVIIKKLIDLSKSNKKLKSNCSESTKVFYETLENALDKTTFNESIKFIKV